MSRYFEGKENAVVEDKQEMEEAPEPTTANYFFIYGTLRKSGINFERFQLDDSNVIAKTKIKNARLFDSVIPVTVLYGTDDDEVVGEIQKYEDQNIVDGIDAMEKMARYKRQKVKVKDNEGKEYDCIMYTKKLEDVKGSERVENGDWIEHIENK